MVEQCRQWFCIARWSLGSQFDVLRQFSKKFHSVWCPSRWPAQRFWKYWLAKVVGKWKRVFYIRSGELVIRHRVLFTFRLWCPSVRWCKWWRKWWSAKLSELFFLCREWFGGWLFAKVQQWSSKLQFCAQLSIEGGKRQECMWKWLPVRRSRQRTGRISEVEENE